jgi:hypothetical protein
MDRDDGNYEGKAEDYSHTYIEGIRYDTPFRARLIKKYGRATSARHLQRCHRVFLDCVDFKNTPGISNIVKAFDFYIQLYC